MASGNSNDGSQDAAILSSVSRPGLEVQEDTAAAPARGSVRAMQRSDIPAVATIFRTAFAKGQPIGDLTSYIEAVFFDCPLYSEEHGGVVYDNGRQGISAAVLSLPMPFIAHDQPVTARLLCAFMADGTRSGALGAARITRYLSLKNVEFCFSDNASPVSLGHWMAGGGTMLPVQSLEWRRGFHPLGALFSGMGRARRTGRLPHAVAPLLRVIDRIMLACKPSLTPRAVPGCTTNTATLQVFFEHAEAMTQRFSVRPMWRRNYFDWLARIAAMNDTLGQLQCRMVEKAGKAIGIYLFAGRPGATARVLNLLCLEDCELDVTNEMFASLASEGYVDAAGMAQPFLMKALMRQRRLIFKHRGYFCLQSRYGDLLDAAKTGDLYIGGLASENWSRLVTDF